MRESSLLIKIYQLLAVPYSETHAMLLTLCPSAMCVFCVA